MPYKQSSSGRIVVLNGFPGAGKFTILKHTKELLPANKTCLLDNHLLIATQCKQSTLTEALNTTSCGASSGSLYSKR